VDLLVLECSFSNDHHHDDHLIPKECGIIALKADAKKLLLTHIYPTSSLDSIRQEIDLYMPEAILAYDLMEISI
jgi:ribonuclease BN (tRNA processing enzyme)